MIVYQLPRNWIQYDVGAVTRQLVETKSVVTSLRMMPYQREWVDALQQMELKREVAGTSRIEGADFSEGELDEAMKETPEQLLTRSQRQVHAAVQTYRWIAQLPHDCPIDEELVLDIHRRIVTGADDDHCPPGRLRVPDHNVSFGQPRHRGAQGGDECADAFARLTKAIQGEYREHDPLIQAMAAHYHLAAMHPFLDGNGRTARVLEALLLQRAGLRDACFIAMSNYYYDEKKGYLASLSEVRTRDHDLTPFLLFGLKGVEIQSRRLLNAIQHQLSKELFRNFMLDLFNRLRSPRKRVIAERQIEILNLLLESDGMNVDQLLRRTVHSYKRLSVPLKALARDLSDLDHLGAIKLEELPGGKYRLAVRLEWPTEITETTFFERLKALPKAKTYSFLR